jgi:hypothetical protein
MAFDANHFNTQLSEITDAMSQGFAKAFNETNKLQAMGPGHEVESMTMLQSVVENNDIKVTTTFKGGKADLFARTYDSFLRQMGGARHSRRTPILSDVTHEFTDREITYSVPLHEADEFIQKMDLAKKFLDMKKADLTALYEIGLSAQQEIGAGQSGVATKYFVYLRKPSPRALPEFSIQMTTNDAKLIRKIADLVTQKAAVDDSMEKALSVKPTFNRVTGEFDGAFDVNYKSYSNGVDIISNNKAGDDLLQEAIKGVAQEMGWRTRTS